MSHGCTRMLAACSFIRLSSEKGWESGEAGRGSGRGVGGASSRPHSPWPRRWHHFLEACFFQVDVFLLLFQALLRARRSKSGWIILETKAERSRCWETGGVGWSAGTRTSLA